MLLSLSGRDDQALVSPVLTNMRENSDVVSLEAGDYIIVAVTYTQGETGQFYLRLVFDPLKDINVYLDKRKNAFTFSLSNIVRYGLSQIDNQLNHSWTFIVLCSVIGAELSEPGNKFKTGIIKSVNT